MYGYRAIFVQSQSRWPCTKITFCNTIFVQNLILHKNENQAGVIGYARLSDFRRLLSQFNGWRFERSSVPPWALETIWSISQPYFESLFPYSVNFIGLKYWSSLYKSGPEGITLSPLFQILRRNCSSGPFKWQVLISGNPHHINSLLVLNLRLIDWCWFRKYLSFKRIGKFGKSVHICWLISLTILCDNVDKDTQFLSVAVETKRLCQHLQSRSEWQAYRNKDTFLSYESP